MKIHADTKIHADFEEACMHVVKRMRGSEEERYSQGGTRRGQEMAAGDWRLRPWTPLAGTKGLLMNTLVLSHATTNHSGIQSHGISQYRVMGTPISLVNGRDAYWVDWYIDVNLTLHPSNLPGYLDTRHVSEFLGVEYFEDRWNGWAYALDAPMAWYAEVSDKRALFIWGGYDGQGYDEGVKRYIEEMFSGVVLEGPRTRVPLSDSVDLVLYAHPDILPSLHVRPSLTSAGDTERILSALRRGRELQELLVRITAS